MRVEKRNDRRKKDAGLVLVAAVFIIVGLLMFGRNMGVVDYRIYRILVSWQMLLLLLGIFNFTRGNSSAGVTLLAIGLFFMVPLVTGAGVGWITTWWPLMFVFVGMGILLKARDTRTGGGRRKPAHRTGEDGETVYHTEDGYVYADTTFGSTRQIVLDPVFRGAEVRTAFGSTVLDLRRTTIAEGDTYIDVQCTFGGVQIFVPEGWSVVNDGLSSFVFGAMDDKRHNSYGNPESDRRIVVRGKVTFGGIEIKY